jgi:hypothetical protein
MTIGMINKMNLPSNGYLCIPDAIKLKGTGLIKRENILMFFFHIAMPPIRKKRAQMPPFTDKPSGNSKKTRNVS